MSHYLLDFTIKSNNFDFDNLIIGRKIKLEEKKSSKYYIYYQPELSENPKEIYIRLPILRLIYNLNNYKFNQINIPIYPNWELTNKFVEFIKQLETDIQGCFINKNINKEFVSIISKKNGINFIKTYIDDNIKLSSNLKEKNITLNDFKITGQIDIVIKLSYIWSKSQKIGLSSHIYQIKYLAPPEQLNIDFIDSDCAEITSKPIIQKYIPKPIQPLNNVDDNVDKKVLRIGIPTIHDLQKAIKELKSIKHK
jgi:hypothetical protein